MKMNQLYYGDFMYDRSFSTKFFIGKLLRLNVKETTNAFKPTGIEVELLFSVDAAYGFTIEGDDVTFSHVYREKYDSNPIFGYLSRFIRDVHFLNDSNAEYIDLESLVGGYFLVGLRDNLSQKTNMRFTNVEICFPITESFLEMMHALEIVDEE